MTTWTQMYVCGIYVYLADENDNGARRRFQQLDKVNHVW